MPCRICNFVNVITEKYLFLSWKLSSKMTFSEANFHVIVTFRRSECYSFSCDQQETFIWDMEYCTLLSCDDQAEIIHLKDEIILWKLKCIQFFWSDQQAWNMDLKYAIILSQQNWPIPIIRLGFDVESDFSEQIFVGFEYAWLMIDDWFWGVIENNNIFGFSMKIAGWDAGNCAKPRRK